VDGPLLQRGTALKKRSIYIVGNNTLQNELISSFLEKETGRECIAVEDLAEMNKPDPNAPAGKPLVLFDCMGKDAVHCTQDLKSTLSPHAGEEIFSNQLVGLFNVKKGGGIEQAGISQGVKGFFYEGESLELFAKGVKAVLDGELWVSRKIMADIIVQNCHTPRSPQQKILSQRETEILTLLAGGATNEEIADRLCISKHTVKGHLYHIFKKIHATSRFQAALWAAKNLLLLLLLWVAGS